MDRANWDVKTWLTIIGIALTLVGAAGTKLWQISQWATRIESRVQHLDATDEFIHGDTRQYVK